MDQIISGKCGAAKLYVLKADIFATFCGGSAKKSARPAGHGGSHRLKLLSLELSPNSPPRQRRLPHLFSPPFLLFFLLILFKKKLSTKPPPIALYLTTTDVQHRGGAT